MTEHDSSDYLEVDNPIPGQHYVCLSFISPEKVLADKQLFFFNKYMSQRCAEFEKKMDEIVEKSSDELKQSIKDDLVKVLYENMRYSYDKFKEEFENFKYKFSEQIDKQFNTVCDFKTSVRGVKIRGVYDTPQEANNKAKELQRRDRSFHIFVGQVGSWLPWDPCADRVTNEEYLEDDLNTMMKKYKENEVARDMFYEEQKRDKMKSAMEERLRNEQKQKDIDITLQEEDPWIKSKFSDSVGENNTTDDSSNEPVNEGEDTEPTLGTSGHDLNENQDKIKEL